MATLSRVDAFTASVFVGRLLADIYNPPKPQIYDDFGEVFFSTQYTTAMVYDPLLPLFRRVEKDPSIKPSLAGILSGYFRCKLHGEGKSVRAIATETAEARLLSFNLS